MFFKIIRLVRVHGKRVSSSFAQLLTSVVRALLHYTCTLVLYLLHYTSAVQSTLALNIDNTHGVQIDTRVIIAFARVHHVG